MGKLSPPTALQADVKHGPRKKQLRGNHSCESVFPMDSAGMTQGILFQGANPFSFWEVY